MELEVIIRKAESRDARKMIEYMHEILSDKTVCLPLYDDEFQISDDKEIEIIERYYNSNTDVFFVVEHNEEIIGILNSNSNSRKATVHDISFGMSIKNEYRNKGIGSKLLNSFINWAKEKPYLYAINLTVWKENVNAIKLYEKFGFHKCGERKFSTYKNNKYHSIFTMELEIQERV